MKVSTTNGNELTAAEKKKIVKDMTIEDIIAWCTQNNQLAWLESKLSEKVERKHYPYVKEIDPETGKKRCKLDENGSRIVDYTKPPKTKQIPIGFMEVKTAFINTFLPELRTGKPKEKTVSMRDKLKAALTQEDTQ